MKQAIVIIGIGELGGVFARGFLRTGYPVYPLTRDIRIADAVQNYPDPELVLVAVGEKDLSAILATMPVRWKNRLGLLQNELLPRDWQAHDMDNPTVISVWFEKKRGQDHKVLLPSRIYGPQAALLADSLASLDIPSKILASADELLFELVFKNVFVLTINIAGLETGGTVGSLWSKHHDLARQIAYEVIDIQEWLTGVDLPRDRLVDGLAEAVDGDPQHKCRGRSAPARLARAIETAADAGLKLPKIREIYARQSR